MEDLYTIDIAEGEEPVEPANPWWLTPALVIGGVVLLLPLLKGDK